MREVDLRNVSTRALRRASSKAAVISAGHGQRGRQLAIAVVSIGALLLMDAQWYLANNVNAWYGILFGLLLPASVALPILGVWRVAYPAVMPESRYRAAVAAYIALGQSGAFHLESNKWKIYGCHDGIDFDCPAGGIYDKRAWEADSGASESVSSGRTHALYYLPEWRPQVVPMNAFAGVFGHWRWLFTVSGPTSERTGCCQTATGSTQIRVLRTESGQ